MTPIRLTILLGSVLAIALGSRADAAAGVMEQGRQSSSADREDTIKAGMVLNFVRYTQWPDDAFGTGSSPIVILILGEGDVGSELEQVVKGQRASNRAIDVRRMSFPQPVEGETQVSEERMAEFNRQLLACHVLYICLSERDRLESILEKVSGADILTVSTIEDFAEHGGMLGLTIRRDRVAFDANVDEIKQTRLRVSSQLLGLARIVKSKG